MGVGDGGRVTVCETGTAVNAPSTITVSTSVAFGLALVGDTGEIGAVRTALRSLLIRGGGCLVPKDEPEL